MASSVQYVGAAVGRHAYCKSHKRLRWYHLVRCDHNSVPIETVDVLAFSTPADCLYFDNASHPRYAPCSVLSKPTPPEPSKSPVPLAPFLTFFLPFKEKFACDHWPAKEMPGWKTVSAPTAMKIMGPSKTMNSASLLARAPLKPCLSSATR